VESNHDLEMLRGGPYPWSVKQRVMSRVGHLSNEALADFFSSDYDGGAAYVVLAHISEHNNHPEVARAAAEHALGTRRTLLHNRVMLALQSEPTEPIRL
jgi:phosphoribosyl 1,2-cyclic phosphodiesterase